ncbi:MAG: hypothetical protein CME61_07190 [Halobacteriovoraceae bacterium]|nr:hypothetical protein [Halobacteriovoraceae bacterium]
MKKLNKKFIFISIGFLFFSCIVYLFLNKDTSLKKEKFSKNTPNNIKNENNATNNVDLKDNISGNKSEINFSSNNVATISKCIGVFHGTSPVDLYDDLVSKENLKKLNQRTNNHFITRDGQVLQQRKEVTKNRTETYLYIVENDLPMLTKKSLDSFGELKKTYEDNQKKYFSASSQLDFVSINGKIVKLDFQNKKAALSCDLLDNQWECLCIKD